MTLRLRAGRLLALLLIVIAQLGATPILASTTPTPTGTATVSVTPTEAPPPTATSGVSTPTASASPTSSDMTATATVSSSPMTSPVQLSPTITNTTASSDTTPPTASATTPTSVPAPTLVTTTTSVPATGTITMSPTATTVLRPRFYAAALATPGLTWDTSVTSLPQALARPAVAVGHDGRFYVFGGTDEVTGEYATTYIYDPRRNTWSQGAAMPVAREGAQAVTLPDGRIAVLGGATMCGDNTCSSGSVLSRVDVYAPGDDTWGTLAAMGTPRYRFAAAFFDGRIYAIGGADDGTVLSSVEAYDPGSDRWSAATDVPHPLEAAAAAVDAHDHLDVIGGFDGGSAFYNTLLAYGSGAWSAGAALPQATEDLGATVGPDGKVYALGGYANGWLTTAQVYDPATARWAATTALPAPTCCAGVVTGVGGQLYVIGGGQSAGAAVAIYGPACSAAPSEGAAGTTVTVSGSGFTPNGGVDVYLGTASGTPLGQGSADGSGAMNLAVTIPMTATSGPTTLTAVDTSAAYPVTTSFTMTASTVTSGLIPWHPHQSVRFAVGLGASVDLADGHVDVSTADMSIPGRGPDLALAHIWDSTLARQGVTTTAGEGWQSSLTPQMGGVLTATVSYTDDSGAAWDFVYGGDPAATGPYTTYTSPLGLPWQLTASSDGYTLTNFLTGATRTFAPSGRLSATADSYGNSDAVVDDGTDQAGGALVDSDGGAIAYSYTNGLVGEEASPLWQSSGGTQGQHVTAVYSGTLLTARTLGAGTADAVTTTFGYSGTQLVTVTTGMGHQWLLGYDDQGRVAAITNTDTTPADVTQFLYTPGQTVAIEGFGQPQQRATIYALDGQGQALSVEDAVGDTTTYDRQHDVTIRADATNAPGHDTTTHYAYTYAGPTGYLGPDGNVGLLTQETSPPVGTYSPQSALAAQTTTYQYDPHTFDQVEVDKPGGGKTRYSYDGHHGRTAMIDLINITSSGCGGQQAQLARPSAAQSPRAGVLVARAMAAPAACGTSPHTFFQWRGQLTGIDAFGEITGTTDARGVTVAQTEDTATPVAVPNAVAAAYTRQDGYTDAAGNDEGDLTSVSSAPITTTRGANASVTTGYAYDQDGQPITTTTPNGALVVATYDSLGRRVRTTQPGIALSVLGPTVTINTSVGYDGDGNAITTTDGACDLTQAGYDALGRTIRTINPVGATTVYTYSGPVLTDAQDTMGHVTHDDYDGADRLIGVTDPLGVRTQYSPDAVGNTVAITTPLDYNNSQTNSVEQRGYDAFNRVTSDAVGGVSETNPSAAQTTTTSYDPDGNVAQVQAPNGDVTYHTYDILDRPQWSEVDPGLLTAPPTSSVAPPVSEAYGFDAAGNLTY